MKHIAYHIPKMLLMLIAAAVIFGLATMILWNAIIPAVFGLGTINFMQAVGLVILGRLLFGFGTGFRGHHARLHNMHGHMHGHMREKWMDMTPDERAEFIRERHPFFRNRTENKDANE